MPVVSFASSKGGVGKSTAAAAIASFLADIGASVHLMDLDPNQTLIEDFDPPDNVTMSAVTLREFPKAFDAVMKAGKASHLLIDLPGVREVTILKAIQRSDLVIIPAQHSKPDIREAMQIIGDVNDSRRTSGLVIPYRLLFTKVHALMSRLDAHVEQQVTDGDIDRFNAMMVDRVAYREMFAGGKPAHLRDQKAEAEIREIVSEIFAASEGGDGNARKAG